MKPLYFCVHAHFYQPPREDPLTGVIPVEPGAAPFRNWNERIHAQCYYPNAILHNFEKISFNMGPTLMEWMFDYDPITLKRIIQQAQSNVERYGVSNAMAQAYNHTILPLATRSDKITQVRWGIYDFEMRFGHSPQGMWLPETAVDIETLEVLAENGIQFTILAPWQGKGIPVSPAHPYRVVLPGGKSLAIFFYDQLISTRLSFDPGATVNADSFVQEFLLPKVKWVNQNGGMPALTLLASDGELYGHHQAFRDKFLAYLVDGAIQDKPIELMYPARWLKEFPVTDTVEIIEPSSWSCHHGVLRWSGECACTPHASWKAPLREAFNEIAEVVDQAYLDWVGNDGKDPWELRHQYIRVVFGEVHLDMLYEQVTGKTLDSVGREKLHLLLRAQYERQRMFTSCGWFFDDFDRIEPKNNVAYAAQAIWLTQMACEKDLSDVVLKKLKEVKSWRTGLTAAEVFSRHLQRAREFWKEKV
ncbi:MULTISPECIES: DUF3536 domain-containing protein [Anaerolinea]|uniref:DUF3536 domain-containing protein n=1 Tax=Anaerolinea TaxID=233189 RepID=UPI002608BA31|nr:DUF3536 domain-containing protein [Anaerolinea thermophila]